MLPECLKMPLRKLILQVRVLLVKEPEVFSPHGIRVQLPRNTDLGLQFRLARGIPHEAAECRMVRRYLSRDTNVLELGGSVGIISATIREVIGPKAFHLIIEANSELIDTCRSNASIDSQPGTVVVLNAAVDYSGAAMVRFCSSSDALGGHLAAQGEHGRFVPATTLSQISDQMPAGNFALICDIEGAEFDLFVNETSCLNRIALIIAETHPAQYTNGLRDVMRIHALLVASGFEKIDAERDVVTYRRVPEKSSSTRSPTSSV